MTQPTLTLISATAARCWHNAHFGGKFPAGLSWVKVEGLQEIPVGRACYLTAGESGLAGIVAVGKQAAKAERKAAA